MDLEAQPLAGALPRSAEGVKSNSMGGPLQVEDSRDQGVGTSYESVGVVERTWKGKYARWCPPLALGDLAAIQKKVLLLLQAPRPG